MSNQLCSMLEDPNLCQLVLGASLENLSQVLSILASVVGSDPTEELCNKALRTRISKLVRALAGSIPQHDFQGAVARIPAEFQMVLRTL